MAAMARRCLACVLALALAGCLPAVLAQDDFSIAFGPVSSSAKTNSQWQVSSQLVTPNNVTIRGAGRTSTVTYRTTVTRTDQGTTWTISGSFVVSAPATAVGEVAFAGPRIALEGQLPLGSPSAYPATCPQLTVTPNASITCTFSISTSVSGLTGIRAQARRGNSLAFVSSSVYPITLGSAANSDANCVSLTDSFTAGQATSGITPASSTNNPFMGLVQVCQTTTLTYSLTLGPFSPNLCGTYGIQNRPQLMSTGAGPVNQQSAAERVTVSLVGCATQDALGGAMPTVRVVNVKAVRVVQFNWTVSSTTTPNNTDGLAIDYKTSRTVKHSVRVTRSLQSTGIKLSGDITIANTQILPYALAGVRVAVYAAGATTNSDPILFVNATCPMSARGQVLVPMQLLQARPGTVTCSYEFMEPTGDPAAVGGVQAQMRTLFANEYNLDSGEPTPYDLTTAAITEQQLGACATMGAIYLNTTTNGSSADPLMPTSITGSMPRLTGGFLPPLPQCVEARSYDWQATYGPWNRMDACGDFLVTPVFSLRPTTGNTSAVNATSLTRVTVTGCNMVPEASASVTGYQAVRAFTWAAKAAVTPGSIAELQFTQQAGVDYMINFTRSSKVAEQTAVGKLVFRNPYSKPIRMAGVTYKVVSPGDGAVLASGDVSCPATGANKTVTVPAAALKGNQTVKGSLTCNLKVVVPGGAKGNLMIGFTTSANATGSVPAVPLVWSNITSKETGKCADVYGYFHQTQPASLVLPLKVDGLMPPEKGKELKLCAPQGYAFKARFGPFPANGCRLQQALLYAGMRPEGAANFTQLSAPLNMRVVGCTGPLPTVRVATATPVNITRLTSWSIKRGGAAAAGESLAMLYTGTSSVPSTVTFEKGSARTVQMWQITGNVLLSNADPSNDAEAEAVRVIATPINRASGSTVQAVTVNATCPTKSGRIFVARAPAQVNCSYSIMVPDAGSWTVTAAAALPKGGRTDSKNTLPVAFSRARVSESGSCAFVSEKLSWSGRVKLAAPKPVGVALPSKETKICATTVYQYHLSVGPFSDTSCGAYQLNSRVSVRAAGGVEARRTSSRTTALQLQGCPP